MKLYQPQDATTNPSLILNAAQIPEYRKLIDDAVAWAKQQSNDRAQQIVDATDKLVSKYWSGNPETGSGPYLN